jgi:hypothetical protein
MKARFSLWTRVVAALVGMSAITGCASELATPASHAEVSNYISGNSFLFGEGGIYFAPDGSTKAISPSGQTLLIGQWTLDYETFVCMSQTGYFLENGKTQSGTGEYCVQYLIQPDGTAVTKQTRVRARPVSIHMAAPVEGFALQTRFNELRRRLGV